MSTTATIDKLAKEATEHGLEIIGPGRNRAYRLYRHIACGHTEEIRPGDVRRGEFRCSTCLQAKLETEATERGLDLIGAGSDSRYRLYRYHACGHTEEISPSQVRKKLFRCFACLQVKLETEATERGLELIGPGRDKNYRLYRHHACGHTWEIRPYDVRRGVIRCFACLQAKLEIEATERGLDLLGSSKRKGASHRLYRYRACGHTEEIQTSSVRRGQFRCSTCLQEKLETEATERGLDLIGLGADYPYRLYRYRACGHTEEIQPARVREGVFRCSACFSAKLETEATERGLDLIGSGKDANYRLYRYHACGHTDEIQTGGVRIGSFRCSTCSPASAGEAALKSCFECSAIHAEPQKAVKIANSNRRFDFEVKLQSQTVLVEFDGLQHFGPEHALQWWDAPEKGFLRQSESDLHKNLYAIETGIPLIRIHYDVHRKCLIPQAVERILALEKDDELDASPFMILPDPDSEGLLIQPLIDFLFEEGRKGVIAARQHPTLPA